MLLIFFLQFDKIPKSPFESSLYRPNVSISVDQHLELFLFIFWKQGVALWTVIMKLKQVFMNFQSRKKSVNN